MMTPDLHFWSQLLLRLAVEAACVVGIAWLLDRMIRPAFWRRAAWQSAAVCLLLLTASELSGFGRGLAGYLFGHARPEPKFVLAASPVAVAPTPPPAAAPAFTPAPLPLPPPPVVKAVVPGPVWWPGLLWLGGAFVILGRVAVAQLLFISLRRRRPGPAHGEWHDRADAILQRLAVRRKIRVLQSPGLTGPLAFGILRPSVGLPADLRPNSAAPNRTPCWRMNWPISPPTIPSGNCWRTRAAPLCGGNRWPGEARRGFIAPANWPPTKPPRSSPTAPPLWPDAS